MSTKKRKARDHKQAPESGPPSLSKKNEEEHAHEASVLCPSQVGPKRRKQQPTPSTTTTTSTARLLVNESCIRTVLRSEDLLTATVTRSGLIKSVAMAAALWVQDNVLLPSVDDDGRVDWAALHQTVMHMDDSPVVKDILPELPERIAIDKGKRKYLAGVKKGGGEKGIKQKQTAVAAAKKKPSASVARKEWKEAAATVSSVTVHIDHEREPSEIIEDEEDYD